MVILATIDEIGNGANFSLVPHCNPKSNGFMVRSLCFLFVSLFLIPITVCGQTGLVGAMGNLGGVWFALMFRFQPTPFGKTFWIAGTVTIVCHFSRIYHDMWRNLIV